MFIQDGGIGTESSPKSIEKFENDDLFDSKGNFWDLGFDVSNKASVLLDEFTFLIIYLFQSVESGPLSTPVSESVSGFVEVLRDLSDSLSVGEFSSSSVDR